jgi:hypothetical protein
MGGVVSWAADGAAWLVEGVSKQIERSTRPELADPWFARRYDAMVMLAGPFVAVFLLLAVGQSILAQDLGRLIRAVGVLLPCSLLLTFAAVTLTQLALRITDEMTAGMLRGSGDDIRKAFETLGQAFAVANSQLAPFVLFLGATFTSLFAMLVWLELVMREAAVYVAVAFLPLTLAAMTWNKTAHWTRRLAEWLLAIILAKFTIAVAFVLAASAITQAPGSEGGLSALLGGCAVLLIAALTPWALLRIIPFAEAAAGRTLSPQHVRGAATSIPGAMTATFAARQLAVRNFGGMGGSRAGSGAPMATAAVPGPMPMSGRGTSSGGPLAHQASTDLPQLPERRPAVPNKEKTR